ncbi:hypothetical protein D9758_010423 [Tetrapyrgos nigripes]|uniref:Uncharacterized protein n=1 Tax=Tetrapyrgos nigripes TaxID=182062 RepID=A0A8H5FPQ8_9AGAR|nr:hypothetical protein D9758_010423 [Tetrapyrgos nigripes]
MQFKSSIILVPLLLVLTTLASPVPERPSVQVSVPVEENTDVNTGAAAAVEGRGGCGRWACF